jgi:glutamate decarboxylase
MLQRILKSPQLHVYNVSPALTVIEKTTANALANLFGFTGPHAGGISTQGGSAANTTALVIARNTLYPSTKTEGNGSHKFVLFTSADGHYSLEKAAQMCGLGSSAVISIPVDPRGCMIHSALEEAVQSAKSSGQTPFFVNATAGTTVLGSYDPFPRIHQICKAHNLWMHIDASWGGPAIFSSTQKHKLHGSHLADSLAVNPHKMMNVPLTCSFLLTNDLTKFHKANTLPAGYLFHGDGNGDADVNGNAEVWDLADLTLQCGRRGDSLKLALSWLYYGPDHYATIIDHAFETAAYLTSLISSHPDFVLVSENPPPCLQVCFYYAPKGEMKSRKENTRLTRNIAERLVPRGFMTDYAPGKEGSMFRIVVNSGTRRGTVEGLVKAIMEIGEEERM